MTHAEYSNFISQTENLRSQLKSAVSEKKKGVEDSTAKVLYKMKAANKNEFLSGVRKQIGKRTNCDEGLAQMFYDYKFSNDKNLVKEE